MLLEFYQEFVRKEGLSMLSVIDRRWGPGRMRVPHSCTRKLFCFGASSSAPGAMIFGRSRGERGPTL